MWFGLPLAILLTSFHMSFTVLIPSHSAKSRRKSLEKHWGKVINAEAMSTLSDAKRCGAMSQEQGEFKEKRDHQYEITLSCFQVERKHF